MVELTQQQNDYITSLTEDWNRLMGGKTPTNFISSELNMAIVTSTASMISEMMLQNADPNTAKIWGFLLLGAFLHNEGLIKLDQGVLQ